MIVKFINEEDEAYPLPMLAVPNRQQYKLVNIEGCTFVPLYQVIDLMIGIKPDEVIRDGVRYCGNCGAKLGGQDVKERTDEMQ